MINIARAQKISGLSLAIVLSALTTLVAQAQSLSIKKANLVMVGDGKSEPLSGMLYRAQSTAVKRAFAAEIDEQGRINPPLQCQPHERFTAEANGIFVFAEDKQPQPCQETLSFRFKKQKVLAAQHGEIEVLWATGKFGQAHFQFADMQAATAKTDPTTSRAMGDLAIFAAAYALGDFKLENLVTRDPLQDYRAVLTPAGFDAIKQLQAASNLKPTGIIDFQTQKAIANIPKLPPIANAPRPQGG